MSEFQLPGGHMARFHGWVFVGLIAGFPCGVRAESPEEIFTKLDSNEDGRLSGKEITDAIRSFDANGDRRITQDEFLAGIAATTNPIQEFTARDLNEDGWLSGKELKGVEAYDTDADGEVSKDEFLAGMAKAAGKPGKTRAQAEQAFTELDITEDGFLSGTEKKSVAAFDADGDGRITRDEFIAGFLGATPEAALTPAELERQLNRAVLANDARTLLKLAHPELASRIDEPILRFMLEMMPQRLGARKDAAITFNTVPETVEGKSFLRHETVVDYESGSAIYQFRSYQGKLAALAISSDDVQNAGLVLLDRLNQDKQFSTDIKETFAPRGEAMIRAVLAGEDKAAYAQLHPLAQEQLPFESTAEGFARARDLFGKLQELELVTMRVEGNDKGELQNIIFGYELKCEKHVANATAIFEVAGYQGALVGYNIKAADDDDPMPENPAARPELALKWQRLLFPKQGLKLEMPGEPKMSTVNGGTIQHVLSLPDHGLTFTARVIRSSQPGREQEALDEYLEGVRADFAVKVLDTDDAPLGDHPGAIVFLQAKGDQVIVRRRVVLSNTVYEFEVLAPTKLSPEAKGTINRFLDSLGLIESKGPSEAAPAPPVPAPAVAPPVAPAPPAPPRTAPPRAVPPK